MLLDIVKKNRSYRRFFQELKIERSNLVKLIEFARYSASGGNMQPIRFILSCDTETNSKVFSCLKWAMFLKDWDGPEEGEKPSAYIVIVRDKSINSPNNLDAGIMAQSILLGAVEKGLGGCMFGAINKPLLSDLLGIDNIKYEIALVIALGKPKEKVVIDDLVPDGDTKYWRDENGVHHVPKRKICELIID
ncbi:MAG TPA: nitroreductase family protein [Clostridiales bacterium]|jgi:nitroreductase|nr:nitroreductase family protein [Clostridiales bacterium]HQP70769.1 nitroreductase family protein [Clostridiales bacterium]